MQKLSDFKPLKRLALPDLGDLDCSGLVLIVGPNSSGKSQLLQDVYRRLCGEPRKLVVATDVRVEKPPFEPFLKCLEDEGYVYTVEDDQGNKKLRPKTMFLGTGQAVGEIPSQQAQSWYGAFSPDDPKSFRRQNEYLNYFGRLLVTGLFLDRRLTSLHPTGTIDFDAQPPQHDLHALYLNDTAREALFNEVLSSFGRAVWPDMSRGNLMCLKVSDEGALPTAQDRLSHSKMSMFRSIETEGDGMKSYLATCIALLLGTRPVCVVDEPEMCLHPPQAYNLGRFIGKYGANPDCVTLVATHSSHLLRGVIQTASKVQIVRLTRRDGQFSAYLVPAIELTEALSRPTLRAEAVLDGIFAQAVVVVESDGDRLVYQAAWETLHDEYHFDLHFSTVGGTGGIADTSRLYRTLKIPIAVIADLDMVVDSDRMERVLEQLIDDSMIRAALLTDSKAVAKAVRDLPPIKTPTETLNELRSLAELPMNWDQKNDLELRRRLRGLATELDRMRRLKRGGIDKYAGQININLRSLLDRLRVHGLFLVPVGELEEWLPQDQVAVSKSDKRAWSNAAAQVIQGEGKREAPLWAFIRSVGSYLENQTRTGHVDSTVSV